MDIPTLTSHTIDTGTFMLIVSPLAGALVTLAGLFYRRLLQENAELKQRLEAYEANAPELIDTLERWMNAYELSSTGSTPSSAPTRSRKRSTP